MNKFNKYMHVERFGKQNVYGINEGRCYIFPKLDGTNGSIWMGEDGYVNCGSRNRELTIDKDNAGFKEYVDNHLRYKRFLHEYQDIILFGEWLVPHTLKTYDDNAWRKFYVFDVAEIINGKLSYINYESYSTELDFFNIEYIKPIAIVDNPTYENLVSLLDQTNYLLKEGEKTGEGIVIKNYNYINKYGNTVWAKILTNEFKEKRKNKGIKSNMESEIVEKQIIDNFCTEDFINKEYYKFKLENNIECFENKDIKKLFNNIFKTLLEEETLNIIRKYKNKPINFYYVEKLSILKIKETLTELF